MALSTLLAALAILPLARGLLTPIKRLVGDAHKLAVGDFTTRVAPTNEDELDRLAEGFSQPTSILEKGQQMHRDFMADTSHKPHTPLAVLHGELEAIRGGVRKFASEALASLQAEVGILTKLVGDLHRLSIPDEGTLVHQRASVDLIPLLEVAGGALHEWFTSRGLKLQFSLPDNITVFGDRDRLMQLFDNLLENSLHHTNGGGSLKISAGRHNKAVRLTFANNAPGVNNDQLQRLFGRFYCIEGSHNRASDDSRLELAIRLDIVEVYNDHVIATRSSSSEPNIIVELPLERDLWKEV